jgi:hypothetical protein
MYFKVKDIVSMALIAVAMEVISFIMLPLVTALFAVIPGVGVLVVAPFYGLLIALILSKVRKTGTATFVSLLVGLPLVLISPSITLFTLGAGLTTDLACLVWKGAFQSQKAMTVISGIYIFSMFYFGLLFGSVFLVAGFAPELLGQEIPLVIACSLLALGMGLAGGFLGVKLSREFRQAG